MLRNNGVTDRIWSVTQVTNYLKELLETDPNLSPVMLKGEISNFHHHSSGHMYFTIKDEKTQLSAVMFKGYNQSLDFIPEDGMSVIVEGKISIYPARGQYQIYVHQMQPDGIGSLHLAYEQLKERLEKEGLFRVELKQAIPKVPAKVGVVTSPTGAAIRDIISVIKRRFSNVSLLIAPSQVQGVGAEETLVRGLELLNQSDVDVIIIGRGGGSIEDLWAFNKEKLARAIFNSRIPIISAVGHETDFTIADFVADLRAPTPSAAAELVVSNREEIVKYLARLYNNLNSAMDNRINRLNDRLLSLKERRALRLPEEKITEYMQQVDELSMKLEKEIGDNLTKKQEELERVVGQLNSLSPLSTFARGYSLARKLDSKEEIKSIAQLEEGEMIEVILKDGALECKVESVTGEK
jgi:exodeoxyribonuclease VII large subunit